MKIRSLPLALASSAILLAACSGDSAGPSTRGQVTFSLATTPGVLPAASALLADTIANGTDTLLLESVQLVLRDVRFERVNDDACEGDEDGDDNSSDSSVVSLHDGDDDDSAGCEYTNAGPFLLDLPLGPGVERGFSVAVDTGSYDELKVHLHKPNPGNDPKDVAFLAAHPEFAGISIRATGTFNGTPFTFESDLNAVQKIDLVPPITVTDSTLNVDVTIRVATDGWFRNGTSVIDPSTGNKGGANDNLVRDNIRNSFHAFRDGNHDGHDDDDEHGEND